LRWHEIMVYTTEEAAEMTAHFMRELGAGGVAIEESGSLDVVRDTSLGQLYDEPLNDIPLGRCEVKAYFAEGSEIKEIHSSLTDALVSLSDFGIEAGDPIIHVKEVFDEDWANEWKKYFKPVRITDKVTVKPSWETYSPSPGELIVEIDPGMAFGTGTHETTALCMRMLERMIQGGEDVIDIGTGSGILAITAMKLGARHVLALDLDPVAVYCTEENVRLNKLQHSITVRKSDLLQALQVANDFIGVQLPVHIVVANILAEIIVQFTDAVYAVLQPNGVYIASGIIQDKEQMVINAFVSSGFKIIEKYYDGKWVAIAAGK